MSWEIRCGDALERLREMPDESVQCCVTSPPYWGLRDYGVDGQLGLESTPEEFVAGMVEVFAEVRRVLRADGTLWLNIADSYISSGGDRGRAPGGPGLVGTPQSERGQVRGGRAPRSGLKPKDLAAVPWRLALSLCDDGWWLRSDTIEEVELYCPCGCGHVMQERIWRHSQDRDLIWSKPNPMPESVTDRPTRSHEYLFLLTKSRSYFYDAEAIREPDKGRDHARQVLDGQPSLEPSNGLASPHRGLRTPAGRDGLGRNKRSVWTIATRPYPEAHFATFPPDLVEPCILAGTAEGDTVLDPFAGAATTGLVATRHNRDFIGLELNPAYVELGRTRIRDDAPLINTPAEVEPVSISGGGSNQMTVQDVISDIEGRAA